MSQVFPTAFAMTSVAAQNIAAGPANLAFNNSAVSNRRGIVQVAISRFRLPANHKYILEAQVIASVNATQYNIQWVNEADSLPVGDFNNSGVSSIVDPLGPVTAWAVFTPTVDTIIRLRLMTLDPVNFPAGQSYVFLRSVK